MAVDCDRRIVVFHSSAINLAMPLGTEAYYVCLSCKRAILLPQMIPHESSPTCPVLSLFLSGDDS